jgi:signal transduction histidine kinase
MGRFVVGLRFRLLLLVALTCTPLIALTLHTAWQDRRHAMADWRQRVLALSESAARDEQTAIRNTRELLAALAKSAPVRAGDQRACQKLVQNLFSSYRRYSNLGVVATNGVVLASAVPLADDLDHVGFSYFRRTLESRAFAAGDFPSDNSEATTMIRFGLPVLGPDKTVLAVVFAALDLDWQQRFASEMPLQLPKGATWTQVTEQGTILARYPQGPRNPKVGQVLGQTNLLKRVFDRPAGVFRARNGRGVHTVYAFAGLKSQLAPGKVAAILSIPQQALFADADRLLVRNLTWLALAIALAVLAGWVGSKWLVLRPVTALVNSSARLAAGDLSARTGLRHGRDELGQLTLAFDQMAQALERRELERRRTNQKLQLLSRRLVDIQESERRNIARELHDEVGQALTAAQITLQAAAANANPPQTEARLKTCSDLVQRVLEQVQDLSLNLRPSMLDDLGLESALRWYTNRQAELTGIQADFVSSPLTRRLDSMIETECFRVAQEALTNVARHAKAQSVIVELKNQDGQLQLSVRDDGIGFDVSAVREQAVRGGSLGVLSMEERAALAGGQLELISSPGTGTEVRACFPLKWRNDQN